MPQVAPTRCIHFAFFRGFAATAIFFAPPLRPQQRCGRGGQALLTVSESPDSVRQHFVGKIEIHYGCARELCSRISAGPPTADAATANPFSIPSMITIPNGSYQLGTTK